MIIKNYKMQYVSYYGGGREYYTDDVVEVIIINYQKLIGG